MNFVSKSVIHENPLGSFTCHKAGTYYFTSALKEGILRIFRTPEKSNSFGRVPVASMLTTRSPKPSKRNKVKDEKTEVEF